jgi:transposase
MPLRMVRRFPPYHEIGKPRERRMAVVRLHAGGWNVNSIASYLGTARSTVYRALRRWIEEGVEGLDDRPNAGGGVRKADLKAYAAVRRLQENPDLGEFRIHAALARMGIQLSPRTCGRILAVNRKLYGPEKPKGPAKQKREMPFLATRRHQWWTADVRYIQDHKLGGGHNLRDLGLGQLLQSDPGEFRLTHPGSPRLFTRAPPGRGKARLPGGARHRRRRGLPREESEGRLRYLGHPEGGDREAPALAVVHRDQLQRPEEDGRLALRESRELGRARGRPREVGGGLQRAETLGAQRPVRRTTLARGGALVGPGGGA